ncbi:maleylpyruvate isomerase family mycothiol-dependent enzyme [Actinomadura chibensis]|uniref:Maleylpyruvate isomerase family mycothiol-dependent enzyme n=1 Tax=Actinomadura chibensis TaxID=392828 RepID=A0A5D0NYE7_9ACTN|nr:maleylpyruvate isomerase family mycothiol-dependent enzyme [Actinomadura chibensis]TYB49733.1 maleylpyruvate isomerase family mycothiol-dependent enzyme [Actinomadura chibensis]
MTRVEPLATITAATRALLVTAARLDDAACRAPSLLPGWTRGHVLTHVARNADGGTRLLTWARTGVESYEYPSAEARAAEIEEGAGRPAAALVADVRESARRFADAYTLMPDEAWERVVQWTSGVRHPAARASDARLTEVLVHHVDLDAGFTPRDWPADFTARMLGSVVASFARRDDAPDLRLHATDTGRDLGSGGGEHVVAGTEASLLAWLMGRSSGADLTGAEGIALPFLY